MHPNEIKITDANRNILMGIAKSLGDRYVEALEEQIKRQTA